MKFTYTHKIFGSLLLSSLFSLNAQAHELVLKVDKISKPKGVMMIALYNSADGYNSDINTFSGKRIAVTQNTLTVNFGDVPAGDYAIKLYHDGNENGVIDKNVIGLPTEGYGFSNNGGAMGQPSFQDAKFTLSSNSTISIHLR